MRIIEIRHHLDGFIVSLTDLKDIRLLASKKEFKKYAVIKEKVFNKSKLKYNLVNAEFFYKNNDVSTLADMRLLLRKFLKPRRVHAGFYK